MSTDETAHVTLYGYRAVDHDDPIREVDLSAFRPADPTRFALYVDFSTDEDVFSAFVCSPVWLAERFDPRPEPFPVPGPGPTPRGSPPVWSDSGAVMFGVGVIFLQRWSYAEFELAVQEVFEANGAATTGAAALEVDRFLPWEFADSPERRQ